MASQTSPRVYLRRFLGRDRLEQAEQAGRQNAELNRSNLERLEQIEFRVQVLGDQVRGLTESVDRLHATIADADPQMLREVIEAVRCDVADLAAQVSTRLADSALARPVSGE